MVRRTARKGANAGRGFGDAPNTQFAAGSGRLATFSFLALTAFACAAQTVYKCGTKGAVTYSHEPCMGGQVVDTTPTQGLDKSSGRSRKGADVRHIEQNKAATDALHPIEFFCSRRRETYGRNTVVGTIVPWSCAASRSIIGSRTAS